MNDNRFKLWFAGSILIIAILACGGSDTAQEAQPAAQQQEQPAVEEPAQEQAAAAPTDTPIPEPTATPEPTPTPEPTATPTPPPVGVSRSNPFPQGSLASAPNWEFQVLEVVRGGAAQQMILAANQFNEPAPEGMEYLLLRLKVKNISTSSEALSIGGFDFAVTGDRLIEYGAASAVEPDPQLDAELFSGGEAEGWASYLVGQGEGNLIMLIDEIFNFEEGGIRYLALDEGAALTVAADLSEVQPTELGDNRSSPAPFGQTVVTEDWEATVLEVVRGPEALQRVQAANQFNEPPGEGLEYVLVKFRVRYIDISDQSETINGFFFKSTGSAGVLYDLPSIVDPDPVLDALLFPGGQYEGWVTLQAAIGETGLMAEFGPLFDLSGANTRYLLLE